MSDTVTPAGEPASAAQERMWLLHEISPSAYNYAVGVRVRGPLNVVALREAMRIVAQRHETLRTSLGLTGDQVTCAVSPTAVVPFALVDVGGDESVLAELVRVEGSRPFSLDRGPLFRLVVFRVADDHSIVLLTLHHAVTDGWSNAVLVRAISSAYRDLVTGVPTQIPRPRSGYGDYARWQRDYLRGDELDTLTAFWRAQVTGLPALRLPTDLPRPSVSDGRGANHAFLVDAELTAGLRALRERHGGSLFMLLLAALGVVLAGVTGQSDLAVGTLVSGRIRPEYEELVGCFVNPVVLRLAPRDGAGFDVFWRTVRRSTLAALAHQELPYEQVLELARRYGETRSPISVLCVFQQNPPGLDLPGLRTELVATDPGMAQSDLVVEIREDGDRLEIALQYDTELFTRPTVELLGRAFETVLRRIAADATSRCGDLLTEDVTPELAAAPDTATVHTLFEQRVDESPDAVALVDGVSVISRGELDRRANRLARRLRSLGVVDGDRVAVLLPRSADAVVAVLAVLKAGAGYLSLDPAHPDARLADVLADARPRLVVTAAALRHRCAPDGTVLVLDRDPLVDRESPARRPRAGHPDAVANLVHTSGSHGRPKTVLGTHRGLVNRIRWQQRVSPAADDDVCVARTAVSFVDSVAETFAPLVSGVPLVVLRDDDTADPARMVDVLRRCRATRIVVVPSLLGMLLDDVPDLSRRLPALRTWVTSGETLTTEAVRRFHRALPGRRLVNLYGQSETAADVTCQDVAAGWERSFVPIGRPVDATTVRVLDPAGHAVLPLVAGELYVGGAGLALGYHDRPGETAARFVPAPSGARWFRTGDGGRVRADGALEFAGRLDAQVQVRGHRVEPGEVERVLTGHAGVRAAAVVGRPDATGAMSLAAYVVPADQNLSVAELAGHAGQTLPAYLVPSSWTLLPELPLNSSGKTDRLALTALPTRPARPVESRQPWTAEQAGVAEVFAELLPDGAHAGPHDDFFALGGHSVLAARAMMLLRERYGVPLALRDLLAAPTISALAAVIEERSAGDAEPAGTVPRITHDPAAAHEPFPLTDVQQAYLAGRHAAFELGEVSTHAYLELSVDDLDVERFTRALRDVVDRHPMLRAVVSEDGTQRVLETVPAYQVEVQDLGGTRNEVLDTRLAAWRERMSHQVLPAGRWPLFDVRVSLLRNGTALVHVSVDALICDAYSFGIVMSELAARYADPDATFPPLELTFRDYLLGTANVDGAVADDAAAYWRARLPELPGGPELPLSIAPAAIGRPTFARRAGLLAAQDWTRLKAAAAERGLSPSAVLLAAFAEVLTAWSRRPHYSVMLTVFNREQLHPDVNRIVGDFTSLSLLEVDHRRGGAFLDRATELQRRLWTDLDARAVSGVTVMREWATLRATAPRLVTPIVFTSNLPVADSVAGGESFGELVYGITQTPQVHLDHQVAEHEGALVYNWDAVEGLFRPGVLDGMFEAYRALLADLSVGVPDWSTPLRPRLPSAQARVRAQVEHAAAAVRHAPRCLHDTVFDIAEAHPDRVALLHRDGAMTCRELAEHAHRVAHTIAALDPDPDSLIGVVARKGWQQVVCALGVLESGRAFLPLDPDSPAARLTDQLRRGKVSVVLTQRALAADLPVPDGVTVVPVDDPAALSDDVERAAVAVDPDDLAYVIFTSGSTGEPKGVMISHRGAANTIDAVNGRHRVGVGDSVLAVSSLTFDLAIYDLFGVLAVGAAVVLPDRTRQHDPAHWAELVAAHRVTVWNSVPALMSLLVEHAERLAPHALASLRLVLLSGDWIPVSLPDRIRALAPDTRVISLGGATEGSIWSVWYPIDKVDPGWPSIPYGKPMDQQALRVLDQELSARPDWVPGELFIGGTGVALAYWGDVDLTAARFPRDPVTGERLYRTGDIARHLPEGDLEILGREDGQVKINGFRVELGEVETALDRLAEVHEAAVVAVGERDGDRKLVAHVVPAPGHAVDPVRLRRQLAETLPGYLIPSAFQRVDRLPLTGNGKVDRGALAATADVAPAPTAAAQHELLAGLAALWAEVLRIETVSPEDNFFVLGGSSLQAIRLVGRLQETLGVKVELTSLFDSPTLGALADAVLAARRSAQPFETAALVSSPDDRHEPFPLTDIQQAYWLGRRSGLTLGGVATHGYVELDVDDLDVDRLTGALNRLIDRHDALRIVVLPNGTQRVLSDLPPMRIPFVDLRNEPAEAAAAHLAGVRAEMSHEVRDAAAWPLFEMRVHRLDDITSRLHISVDLLIADAHSTRVLTGELLAWYHDPDWQPVPLRCTFRDYVLALERSRTGASHRRAEAYWGARIADLPPAPELPLRHRPEELETLRFHRLRTELPERTWRSLRSVAANMDVTPSMLVCAVFCDVLATWNGGNPFTLNVTTFNRLPLHPDVDSLVGDFTATTLLAVDGAGTSFTERTRRLQTQLWRDLEHGSVSGIAVQRMLRREPHRRDESLMPVVFTSMLTTDETGSTAPPWRMRQVFAVSQTPQVLLDHQIGDYAGTLISTWDFVIRAFQPGVVEAMFETFHTRLACLAGESAPTEGDAA
jgi:nonribosomal peptide synthetase protein BlmIV